MSFSAVSFFLGLAMMMVGCDRPVDAPPPTIDVLAQPWGGDADVYASCASCHLYDGSGRPDGSIPQLAGQRAAVLIHKLEKLQSGHVTLPVMLPFARALDANQVSEVANNLAARPMQPFGAPVTVGRQAYTAYCSACHGPAGEGRDGLLAPRLCGQHAAYILRRMQDSVDSVRGDADPAMAAIVATLPQAKRNEIAAWLAGGACVGRNAP